MNEQIPNRQAAHHDRAVQVLSRRNTIGTLFDIMVIAAVLPLLGLWRMDPILGTLTRLWWNGQEAQFVAGWKSVDAAVLQAAGAGTSNNGNTALSVSALNPDNAEHVAYSDAMLMRGGYTLYPRIIWAAPEGTALNGGADAIAGRFHPSVEWLRAHGVRSVLDATPDPSGKVATSILLLPRGTDQK